MSNKLEENVKETNEKLMRVTHNINNYHELNNTHGDNDIREYKKNLDIRDNLVIALNYYQNQVLIEQNKEIINNLNTLIRRGN